MRRIARRCIHVLIFATAALATAGCAHGGNDVWARASDHVEWHVLGGYKTFAEFHRILDKHILDADIRDPDTY